MVEAVFFAPFGDLLVIFLVDVGGVPAAGLLQMGEELLCGESLCPVNRIGGGNTRIRIPIEFRYDNGRKRIYYPELPDEQLKINVPLATGIARAYRWQELLDSGEYDSPEALAEALNVNVSYVRRFLRLTLLAPPIVEAIFEGRAPWSLSLTKLDTNLPYSWKEQMKLFGME